VTTPLDYAHDHAHEFRQQLYDLIRIPSVSTDPAHKADVQKAAEWVANELRRVGANNVEIIPTAGHPVVYADWLGAGTGAPTILIYGHYDVQPADKVADGWTTEQFEPFERDGQIVARGSSDDKGQMFIHIKVLESYLATEGKLPVNIKFMYEGEEEVASPNLKPFIRANKDRLKADVCVISDGGRFEKSRPNIDYSVRGMTYMQLNVWGPTQDLHSGGFGGMVHNPALALAQIIGKLHNADNSVAVPGFYDDVRPLDAEEKAELEKQVVTDDMIKEAAGVTETWGEEGYSLVERNTARPTLEINGLLSGWTGDGAKTVLPAKAMAKISCRLVANQNPHKIYELVKAYIAQITPPAIHSELKLLNAADPATVDIHMPEMKAAKRAYEQVWGISPLLARGGGTLPVIADLKNELGLSSLMMSYGGDNDGAHGPDEHFPIELFHKGIDTAIVFLTEVVKPE
jgi:acetylornithine deacetylase/succinyl-diaminopimelate desuccinylase-like protein